jgi:hypothetical protein
MCMYLLKKWAAVIFLFHTAVVWISGIIALFTLAPFSIKDLPSGLQYIPISVAGYYSVLNCISLSYHKENIQGKEKQLEILSVKYKIAANDSSRSLYPKL